MSWTIQGVNEWSAADATDGLPVTGTRAWPTGANASGDLGLMLLSAAQASSPPSGIGAWTLLESFTTGDTDANGLRNCWLYYHVRGGSDPAIHDTWVTGYAGLIATYRHSSETTFTFGTVVEASTDPASTSHTNSGVTSAADDSLVFVAHANGRATPSALSATNPSTGVSSSTEDTTTAPSTSAWYMRATRSNGAAASVAVAVFDGVLNNTVSTGTITITALSTKGVTMAVTVKPGSGGGGGSAIAAILSNYKRRRA